MYSPTGLDALKDGIFQKCLSWLRLNVHRFHPNQEWKLKTYSLKAFNELLLLCGLYTRQYASTNAQIQELIGLSCSILKGINYVDNILCRPELLIPYLIYLCLRDCGVEFSDMRKILQRTVDVEEGIFMDRDLFHIMELRYLLVRGKFLHSLPRVISM